MYLIDTDLILEARRGTPEATTWLRSVSSVNIFLSTLTLGDIARAISVKQTYDPRASAELSRWLRKLQHDHADRILPVTAQIAVEWGRLAAQGSYSQMTGLIAATAIVHDLVVATANADNFAGSGVRTVDPWHLA
jgi:predicted nucleic acid-binding protein